MKNFKKHLLLITVLLTTLCVPAQKWNKKGIKGNGEITTKTITTADYDKIKVAGSMNVTLIKGTEGSIQVTTDSNLQEYIKVASNDGVLSIAMKTKGWFRTKKGIQITVPFKDISEVSLAGSGDIVTNATIQSNSFTTKMAGSGDIELAVAAETVTAKLSGSGDIKLTGTTNDFSAKLSGSGDIDGRGLKANITDAAVAGSGDIDVYARKSIKARVSGSGEINYTGSPENVDKKTNGSGRISGN